MLFISTACLTGVLFIQVRGRGMKSPAAVGRITKSPPATIAVADTTKKNTSKTKTRSSFCVIS